MSDTSNDDGAKHEAARHEAEAALRAQERGDDAEADRLFEQANRTDPEAVEDVLQEEGAPVPSDAAGAGDDEEVARISRQIEPHSDAPSRAGITPSGSGADGMGE